MQQYLQADLTVFVSGLKMGWVRPSGGLVSAVRYASEVHGESCQRLAHEAIAACSVFFFWCLIVWGSSSGFGSVVCVASRASCFALLKPMKRVDLGSHSS